MRSFLLSDKVLNPVVQVDLYSDVKTFLIFYIRLTIEVNTLYSQFNLDNGINIIKLNYMKGGVYTGYWYKLDDSLKQK